MTEQTLELAMLLPREAECGTCVDEVGRELSRLDGVHAVEADVPRGLLNVRFDESTLGAEAVRTLARRAGTQAHCADHCPVAVHDHGQLDLLLPLPGEDGSVRRLGYDTVERKTASAAPGTTAGTAAARGSAAGRVPWFRERRALLTLLSGALVVAGFVAGALAPAASPWVFAAPRAASVIRTFMSTWRARRLKNAARAT